MIEPELAAVFIGSSIRLAAPLLLAATGELVSERAGVLNMSVEGMMLAGAFAGATASWLTGSPLLGLLFGVLCVLPVAWLQAFLSITLRANQIVTGIGINILVLGASTLGYRALFAAALDTWRADRVSEGYTTEATQVMLALLLPPHLAADLTAFELR